MTDNVDILMPLRAGAPLQGEVVAGFVKQTIPWRWYINVQDTPPLEPAHREVVQRLGTASEWCNLLTHTYIVSGKREGLRNVGERAFVYHSDADVILSDPRTLETLRTCLETEPKLGATGVLYDHEWPAPDADPHLLAVYQEHLGCGSMMLRRRDWAEVGPLKATPCECTFIRNRLLEMGKRAFPIIRLMHAHQWKRTELRTDNGPVHDQSIDNPCPLCGERLELVPETNKVDVECTIEGGVGEISRAFLVNLVEQHGTAFRVFPRAS